MASKGRGDVDALRQLYGRGDFEAVLTRTEQHLKKKRSADDKNARILEAARVAALIQLGRSAEAVAKLEALERAPADPRVNAFISFARPYLAWVTNSGVSDAIAALGNQSGDDARKLGAQLLYRAGKYDDAAAVYQMLFDEARATLAEKKKPTATSRWTLRAAAVTVPVTAAELETLSQNVNELATNLMATLVLCGRADDAMAIKEGLQSSYELEYNSTCASIGAKDFGMADICLEQAEALLKAATEGDDDNDLDDDLAPVKVQRAYLNHVNGRVGDAKDEYASIVKTKSADPASLAVAANNLTVALGQLAFDKEVLELERKKAVEASGTGGSETEGATLGKAVSDKKADKDRHDALSDGLKKMRATSGAKIEAKLTYQQRRAMARNRSILLVQMGRLDGCKAELDRLKVAFPGDIVNSLIEASLVAKRSDLASADAILTAAGDNDTIRAARVQLAEESGDIIGAAELLVKLFPGRPAAVATAAAMFEEGGDSDRAIKLLTEAADGTSESSAAAKRALAELLVRLEKHADASAVLEQLLKLNPTDSVVLAQLVAATSFFDAKRAETLAERLPPLPPSVLDGATAAELESLPPPKRRNAAAARAKAANAAQQNGEPMVVEPAGGGLKKRKRKKRLPKNYDPDGPPPDPERWLPKAMRAGYKKKKRRGEPNFRGAQGADAASAEAAAAKNAEKSAARAAAAEAGPQPTPSGRPKGAKKKKKNRR